MNMFMKSVEWGYVSGMKRISLLLGVLKDTEGDSMWSLDIKRWTFPEKLISS